MKKLKILISTLSVLALMCFANLASAQASYLLTTDALSTYPGAQIVPVTVSVAPTAISTTKTMTLTLLSGAVTNDLDTKAVNSTAGSAIVVSTSGNQIIIIVEQSVGLKDLSKQFFNNGIAVGKEILMQLL